MGTYLCRATNVAGSDECSAFLSVRGQYQQEARIRGSKFISKKISFFLCCIFLMTVIFKRSSNVLLLCLFYLCA